MVSRECFIWLGAALVTVLATLLFKAAALVRMKRLLGIAAVDLLPWRSLGALLAAAACGASVVLAVKSLIHVSSLPSILATGLVFAATYGGLVWRFDLLNESERLAIAGWVRRIRIATGMSLGYERGYSVHGLCAELPASLAWKANLFSSRKCGICVCPSPTGVPTTRVTTSARE